MTLKSRAAIAYRTNQPMAIDMIDVDSPGPGEVLVEIKATGLCHTDLTAIEGKTTGMINFPGIPGHEAGGVVVELGPGVTSLAVSDHVIPFMCSECSYLSGLNNAAIAPIANRPKPIFAKRCLLGTIKSRAVRAEVSAGTPFSISVHLQISGSIAR